MAVPWSVITNVTLKDGTLAGIIGGTIKESPPKTPLLTCTGPIRTYGYNGSLKTKRSSWSFVGTSVSMA